MYKLIAAFLLLLPLKIQALTSADSGLDEAADGLFDTNLSLAGWINIIIRGILSLLAIIFIILIIIGGFKWMTSRGDSKQVSEAKDMITNAIIGVTIVVVSYAITAFVFNVLLNVDGSGGNAEGNP